MRETVKMLRSIHLNNERFIWICAPTNPVSASRLTVFLDGEFYRDHVGAMSTIADLRARNKIVDSWFVFVSMANMDARWRECPCFRPFAQFIVDEMLAWLEKQEAAIRGVRERILVGLSYTGLAASFIAKEYPGVFQKVISQSGSYWYDDCRLAKDYHWLSKNLPTEFYLEVGTHETQENVRHREDVLQIVSQVEGVRRFRDLLIKRDYLVNYTEFNGGHDFAEWKKTLPVALQWALPIQ